MDRPAVHHRLRGEPEQPLRSEVRHAVGQRLAVAGVREVRGVSAELRLEVGLPQIERFDHVTIRVEDAIAVAHGTSPLLPVPDPPDLA
jgi:hypothetical protein